MVGISITFLVKKRTEKKTQIFYSGVDWKATRLEKFALLEKAKVFSKLDYQTIQPDKKHTWLTDGLHSEFDDFLPLGTKEAKIKNASDEGVIFKWYSGGIKTNRDAWAYNFSQSELANNMQRMIETYNDQVFKWTQQADKQTQVDNFVWYDDHKISWSESLKANLKRGKFTKFEINKIRQSLYRPFTKSNLFFDRMFNERVYVFPKIFPTPKTETENKVICCTNHSQIPFAVQITNCIPDVAVGGRNGQCFPFYTYDEDGTNRTENITDWALNHWQQHYQDKAITKWALFYYVYALLHHPDYREKYAQNLKRELPRLPLAPQFWDFAHAGKQLADLHLNYEQAKPYPLEEIENPKYPFSLEVDKMRLSKDKTQLIYNNFLTLKGIPKQAFDYKLGNRSALDWIIDQYRIKIDKRSGIVNNPNRLDDEEYIVRLIGQVVFVSVETVAEILKLSDLAL